MPTVEISLPPSIAAGELASMIPPERTALVIIDAQVDFISPEGPIGRSGLDLSPVYTALKKINQMIPAARKAGAPVVFVRVITRDSTDSQALKLFHARRSGGNVGSVAICRAGTKGADYYGVKPEPGDMEIEKVLYSTFYGTNFDERLRARGIENIVICGFTTECCVETTVRDAFHRNYNMFVVRDACAAYDAAMHVGALGAMSENCALLTEADFVISAWQR